MVQYFGVLVQSSFPHLSKNSVQSCGKLFSGLYHGTIFCDLGTVLVQYGLYQSANRGENVKIRSWYSILVILVQCVIMALVQSLQNKRHYLSIVPFVVSFVLF